MISNRRIWPTSCANPLVGLITFLMLTLSGAPLDAQETSVTLPPQLKQFFSRHCTQCNGPVQQKGDRRLDNWPDQLDAGGDALLLLEEALDAVNRGDMPPESSETPVPDEETTRLFVQQATRILSQVADSQANSTTVLRRLNRFEYVNTMSDLLGLRKAFFSRTSDFPTDASQEGFDNNGAALTLSDHQLKRYLEVAEEALEAASFFGVRRPEAQVWQFSASDFNGVTAYERAPVTWRLIVDDKYLEVGHGQPAERHANFAKPFVKQGGAPADGWYTIRVTAAAANRLDHGYQHEEFDRYLQQRLKLALWVAPNERLLEKNAVDQRELLTVWDLPDGEPEVFTKRVWLNQGAIPFVSWTNGISSKGNIRRVAERHHPEVIRATKTQRDAASLGNVEAQKLVEQLDRNRENRLLSEVYQGPRVRVWGMEIAGPEYPQWPPASHRLIYGDQTDATQIDIPRVIQRFAERAFRRPVPLPEVQHYIDFVQSKIQSGSQAEVALQQGLAAILVSPRFLYLDEGDETAGRRMDAYELASRLSYFLWGTLPDEELLTAAASGALTTPKGLDRQVERLLSDARSAAFVEHFTDSWLGLAELGSMPPDSKTFEAYYRDRLETFFKTETRMFFGDLLTQNHSILNLLESDYTFVNGPLAKHYGIEGVHGEAFRRVDLNPDHHRGGLLGQGSVLTVTANGIETSPVVRGVWVLEKILGSSPPPPPPDVEPLEPDIRGTTTIREQLLKHRNVATCAECHQKIDPAGFALEFFDPIGGFRTRYPGRGERGKTVDGSGRLPSGESFDNERELKRILLTRGDRFTETLTEKLMTYATGRSMTYREHEEIQRIASGSVAEGQGLRDLVKRVVQSELFRQR